MSATVTLSLRRDVEIASDGDEIVLRGSRPQAVVRLKQVTPALHDAIRRLATDRASEGELSGMALEGDGPTGLFKLSHYVKRLTAAALVRRTLVDGEALVATLEPMSLRFRVHDAPPEEATVTLSPFACCRREGSTLIVESPHAPARIVLHDPRAAMLIGILANGATRDDLARAVDLSRDALTIFLAFLASAGVFDEAPAATAALAQWEFHDLFFHTRNRLGRHNYPFGGTFPFKDTIKPLPAVKPPMSAQVVGLPPPDLQALIARDRTLTDVLESRQSHREFGADPMTLPQLGEFLYRVGRIKSRRSGHFGEVIQRPYPSGGALYELEIYPVIDRCSGLASGLYHYASADHQLERVCDRTPDVEGLLDDAWAASERHSRPQILLVIAARFQRVQWKYRMVSYSLVLKHVGVLYQTMYLVATAMGLGGCALGGGDSDRFAEAAGLNYLEETSVGEFMLGSRAS